MSTFNWVVFFWDISFAVAIITFFVGVFKKSRIFMLVSFLTFLPIAFYFSGALNAWRIAGLVPLLPFALFIKYWQRRKS